MTNSSVIVKPADKGRAKSEKLHHFLSLTSTAIGVIGAVGTLFVWLVANFYVGDVEIRPDNMSDVLTIKVYNPKGQESIYHSPRFQLMPGTYHLAVSAEGTKSAHADVQVYFQGKTMVPIRMIDGDQDGQSQSGGPKHHWWEFWR